MNDKQLQSLIGMALETEDLLGGEARPEPAMHPAGGSRSRMHRRLSIGLGLTALAATIALVVGTAIFMQPSPKTPPIVRNTSTPTQPGPGSGASAVEVTNVVANPTPVQKAGCPDESVVLAIYEDAAGAIRCVRWRTHDWKDGRCLREVNPAELLCAGFGPPCQADLKPHRLMVVALSGPKDRLPATDEGAQEIASCIAHSPVANEEPGHGPACAAVACVPPDVTVRVETLAMNR